MDGPLTWFAIWAEVQSEFGAETPMVSVQTRQNILCSIDTEEPGAELGERLGIFHRTTRQVLCEAIEKALKFETIDDPFVFVSMKFNAEEGSGAEVDRIELRIEKRESDGGRWRLTVNYREDKQLSWHDEAGSAVAGCMAAIAQTTKTWLAEAADLDPQTVFANKRLTDLERYLRDNAQRLRLSPGRN